MLRYGMPAPQGRFDSFFKCHSPGVIMRPELETGGKIILPASALDMLTRLHIEYPMLFEISNPALGRKTHCGVLEFVAEEGFCYIPYWMMQHLLIEEGQMIQIKSVALQRGTYVKLQPHTTSFIEISNPRAVLENALRRFATLTKDEVIMINYNNKNYYLTVVETKPKDAISIIETDLVLDFAAPLDYKEPTPASSSGTHVTSSAQSIPGRKSGAEDTQSSSASSAGKPGSFKAFGGSGVRLDGKGTPPFATTPPIGGGLTFGNTATATTATTTAGKPNKRPADSEDDSEDESSEEEDSTSKKFVAFSGKGYSLKK